MWAETAPGHSSKTKIEMCTYESLQWYVGPMLRYQLDELAHLKHTKQVMRHYPLA